MRLIKCNRCKKEKEIKEVKKIGYINLGKRDVVTGEREGKREFDDWDICDDCLMQIKDFLHMAPLKLKMNESLLTPWAMEQIKATEEPGQQAEEPIAPAQKKQPTIGDTNVKTDSAIAENSPSATAEEPEQVEIDEILPAPEEPDPLRDLKDRFTAELNSLRVMLDCENFSGMAQSIERLEHLRIKMAGMAALKWSED